MPKSDGVAVKGPLVPALRDDEYVRCGDFRVGQQIRLNGPHGFWNKSEDSLIQTPRCEGISLTCV
eukprot:4118831-Amphidinium_carterae.2